MPLLSFGMQGTIIKFYSSYKTKFERDTFLTNTLLIPLFIIIPLALIGSYFYEFIANWLSRENILIKDYTYLIFIVAVFMGYFEVFYCWSKVQLKSVFGNFIKEIFVRFSVTILLFLVYFKLLSNAQFIYAIVCIYGVRTLIMLWYAIKVYKPEFILKFSTNLKEIVKFSSYIIIAGSAGGVLLEIDKVMIPQTEEIAQVAYYAVGIYIASVVAIPTRAMQQITNPITAKELNNNNLNEVETLFKQTSINLLVVGGLFFLLINLNIADLYAIINKPEYTKGIVIVFIVSVAKLIELALGTANAILVNSKYYKTFFYLSLLMALSVYLLNKWLIGLMGIKGAALATLIVVFVYSILKIVYINLKFKIQPFSIKTLILFIIVGGLFYGFSFLEINFHPIINILIKSFVIVIIYSVLVKYLKISDDLNELFGKLIKKKAH
jgi:O-antigen/teichoic acid export membrane protein